VAADDTKSWERNGLGKTRYGGQAQAATACCSRVRARSSSSQVRIRPDRPCVLTAAPEQYQALSVIEAYLQYKPAPTGDFGVRARGGFSSRRFRWRTPAWPGPALYPDVVGHQQLVGEELRTVGGEFTGFLPQRRPGTRPHRRIYTANDPAGTQLTWRGWSFNDREIGLFDRLQLTQIPVIQPTGGLPNRRRRKSRSTRSTPTWGITPAPRWITRLGKVTLLRYDNNANDRAFQLGQWAWHTDFWAAAIPPACPGNVDFRGPIYDRPNDRGNLALPARTDRLRRLLVAYGLVSKEWGRHRVSFRVDRFVTASEDHPAPDDTNEHGTALTLAYNFRPAANQRITLELLHVDSTRPERAAIASRSTPARPNSWRASACSSSPLSPEI